MRFWNEAGLGGVGGWISSQVGEVGGSLFGDANEMVRAAGEEFGVFHGEVTERGGKTDVFPNAKREISRAFLNVEEDATERSRPWWERGRLEGRREELGRDGTPGPEQAEFALR